MKSLFPLATVAMLIASTGFGQVVAPVPLNQAPSRILGHPLPEQFNLVSVAPNLVEGRELFAPRGVALDTSVTPPILYVSDFGNNRVLGWKNAQSFRNGQTADIVIGQTDLYRTLASGPSTTFTAGLSAPTGLAVYKGDLYVADTGNNRYMRFRKPFNNIGNQFPDLFIGQPNGTSRSPNYNGATDRQGIFLASGSTAFDGNMAFDSAGNLWVTDPGNQRVLQFSATDVANGGGGLRATLELGKLDFGPAQAQNQITVATRTDPKFLGVTNGIAIDPDSGRLFVGDQGTGVSRVLVFTPPFLNGMAASRIMGIFPGTSNVSVCEGATQDSCDKTAFQSANGVFLIPGANGKMVGVVDRISSRIVLFDPFEKWPDQANTFSPLAIAVIGQTDFSKRGLNGGSINFTSSPGPSTFLGPISAAFSGSELFVADSSNNRVVALPFTNGTFGPATRVLGQDFFTTMAPNLIEGREFQFASPAGVDAGLVIDSTGDTPHLYVSDTYNNRVLGFRDSRKVQPGQKADLVIGQADFTTSLCNFQGLTNPDSGNTDKPTQSSLCLPTGLAVDSAGNLYVADSANSRVLRFPAPFSRLGPLPQADLVLGQRNFTTIITDPTPNTMSQPYGLAFAGTTGLLVSDTVHNRVLMFPFSAGGTFNAGTDNGKAATKVFGQTDFNSVAPGSTDNTMRAPHHIATDIEAHIYIADTGNGRVMIFDQINSNANSGAPAAKILNGLGNVRAIFVNQTTGELWVGDNTSVVKKYPQFSTLLLNPASTGNVLTSQAALALGQDSFGDLALADASNRIGFYYPGVQAYNGANFSPSARLAPGTFASVCSPDSACDPSKRVKEFGSIETTNGSLPNPVPYPKDLGDVQVLFNGIPAPLTYVSPSQINFVVPMSAPTGGTADIAVVQTSTGRVYGAGTVGMQQYSPGVFTLEFFGAKRQAAVANQDGTVNSPTNCAPAGTYVSIYATGQGFVPNAPPDGAPPQGLVVPPATARVAFGQGFTDTLTLEPGEPKDQLVLTALSPQFPGVWQINAYVPKQTVADPQVPIGVLVGSQLSNTPAESGYQTTICVKRP